MPVAHLTRAAPGYNVARLDYPYDPDVTEAIRRIPGREWNRTYKFWSFPLTPANVLMLRESLVHIGWALTMPADVAKALNEEYALAKKAGAVRAAGDSDIAFAYRTEPYAHQRAGLAFLAHLNGGGLLWEMGLGKTKTAIDYAEWLHQREHDALQGNDRQANGAAPLGTAEPRASAGLPPSLLSGKPRDIQGESASLSGNTPRADQRDGSTGLAVASLGGHTRGVDGANRTAAGPLRSVSSVLGAKDSRRPQSRDGWTTGPPLSALQSRDRATPRQPSDHETGCPVCGFCVLVITPNTVKRNWGEEIEKHAGHSDYVIPRGTIAKRVEQLGQATYTIVNCETLSHKAMAEALRGIKWSLTAVDESTRFKTPSAARTKALMKLNTKRRVILTGTPITGKPQDAFVQFEWVKPGTFGRSYWTFAERYLQKDWFGNVTGLKPENAAELRSRIDAVGYRLLKSDVLDLPEKVYTTRRVEMVGEQLRAYRQMRDELRIELANNTEIRANNILTVVLRLTQVTAGLVGERGSYQWLNDNAKLVELRALLNEELANEQVVIFGIYQAELEALAAEFGAPAKFAGKTSPALPIIYGPTPERDRQELINEFQAGDRRLLFAQVRTGGIGINLTAAHNAIYYTRGWSLEEWLQSQDRLHRIGQTGTVNIIPLVAEGSIDEDIADALSEKKNMADYLTGDAARALAARLLGK